jgi:lipoprotein-anchoring transpeptidase ErfK/SrfK
VGDYAVNTHRGSGGCSWVIVVQAPVYHYIQIIDGCGPYYNTGVCVNMRSGPGTQYPVVGRLRTGVVLKVEDDSTGSGWYKIIFDGAIRYPERVSGNWYVAADPEAVRLVEDSGDSESQPGVAASTTKRIVVDLSQEKLYAYDGDTLFMQEAISNGLDATPTPKGTFTVYKKTPSRYMQGPIEGVSDQYYDLPGVPWNLYFTVGGAVIHGAYWHDHFGEPWSHGCVNLPPDQAKKLYDWAVLGTPVLVRP